MKLVEERPAGWEQHGLTTYFETAWSNTLATFHAKTESLRLCQIDYLMFEVASGWKNEAPTAQSVVPILLYYRAHSAFRSACTLGMGGALPEGMGVLRMALENAGYAALIHRNPELANVWWDRDVDEEKQRKARRAFHHGAAKSAVSSAEPQLGEAYDSLYDRVIKFGAHPNQMGVTSSLKVINSEQETHLNQFYLQGDGPTLDHWIRTASQIGISVLMIFSKLYPDRFNGSIRQRLGALSTGL